MIYTATLEFDCPQRLLFLLFSVFSDLSGLIKSVQCEATEASDEVFKTF